MFRRGSTFGLFWESALMSNQLILDNLRLRELRIVAEQNRDFFNEFISLLNSCGYASLSAFVNESDDTKAATTVATYMSHPFKADLHNGIGNSYDAPKARWYFLSWVFRDAPAQRLEPILSTVSGSTQGQRALWME